MISVLSAKGLRFMDIISYPEINIQENRFTFITGESGCGKSTLLKILNSTVLPTDGSVLYRGDDIQGMNKIEYRRKVLLASQDIFLFDGSVRDNFNLFYSSCEKPSPEEGTVNNLLQTCCADFPADSNCSILSGGERQRVFLAVCLSFMPDVLLLDEPTSALDGKTAKQLLTNIKNFSRENGITPVAVCHNEELVSDFSDNTIKLKREWAE